MVSTSEPILAIEVEPRAVQSVYPAALAERIAGRQKRALGDAFGLTRYGVNLTILPANGQSALLHRHAAQEEFIYILQGYPTLRTEHAEVELAPGMCAGFRPNEAAHHLINRSADEVHYLEVGDRTEPDDVEYPEDDVIAKKISGEWHFMHRDGSPW